MEDVIDRPEDRRKHQHDQEQELVVPEHERGGDRHLADLHEADKQHFLHADANVFDVGRHAADDAADLRAVKEAHWHPLQMGKQRDPQIADDRFTQLERVELAEVHDPLSGNRERRETCSPPDHSDPVSPLNRPVDDGGDHPGERGELDRADNHREAEPVAHRGVGSRVLKQPGNQPEIERMLIGFALFVSGELRQRAQNRPARRVECSRWDPFASPIGRRSVTGGSRGVVHQVGKLQFGQPSIGAGSRPSAPHAFPLRQRALLPARKCDRPVAAC